MDGSEVVVVAFVISGCDGAEVFELVEEPLDSVALAVDPGTESRVSDAVRHRADIPPGATVGKRLTQRVAVIGTVREQDVACFERIEHVGGGSAVMGLTLGQLELLFNILKNFR